MNKFRTKSSMQKKKESFMHKKSEALDEATAKRALAKHLGVQSRAIKDSDDYEHLEPDYEFSVDVDGETQVWGVYQNEDSAITAAVDDLAEKFKDDPAILAAAIEYYGINAVLDYFDSDDEQDEEIRNLYDELGKEEFAEWALNAFVDGNWIPFDKRAFAQHNIDDLGAAWHLAQYDGEEVELSNGLLAYRFD